MRTLMKIILAIGAIAVVAQSIEPDVLKLVKTLGVYAAGGAVAVWIGGGIASRCWKSRGADLSRIRWWLIPLPAFYVANALIAAMDPLPGTWAILGLTFLLLIAGLSGRGPLGRLVARVARRWNKRKRKRAVLLGRLAGLNVAAGVVLTLLVLHAVA